MRVVNVRVVIDTNILISAVLKPQGLEAGIVQRILTGELTAFVTPQIREEYEEVFARRKFAAIREASRNLLDALEARSHLTAPTPVDIPLDDPDDRIFLECAHAATADFLITGNLRHYPPVFGATRVVNARAFSTFGRPTTSGVNV